MRLYRQNYLAAKGENLFLGGRKEGRKEGRPFYPGTKEGKCEGGTVLVVRADILVANNTVQVSFLTYKEIAVLSGLAYICLRPKIKALSSYVGECCLFV